MRKLRRRRVRQCPPSDCYGDLRHQPSSLPGCQSLGHCESSSAAPRVPTTTHSHHSVTTLTPQFNDLCQPQAEPPRFLPFPPHLWGQGALCWRASVLALSHGAGAPNLRDLTSAGLRRSCNNNRSKVQCTWLIPKPSSPSLWKH